MPHPRLLLAAAALACATACAAPSGRSPDSATWQLDAVPFVDIGTRDDDTLVMLARPHSAVLIHDSLVAVGDYRIAELRVFDLAGHFVRTIGRAGEGPGEFRTVFALRRCGDSLHVYDSRVQATLVFGTDGGFGRRFRDTGPERIPGTMPFAAACNRAGQYIKQSYWRLDTEGPATIRPDVTIWLTTADDSIMGDLGDFPGPDLHVHRGFGSSSALPMGRSTLVAIGSDRAYVGTGDSSLILTYRLDGTLLSAITTPYAPRPATAADRAWFMRNDTLGGDPQLISNRKLVWAETTFPDRVPPYTALLVDADDRLWIRGFPVDSARTVRWTAMSAAGQVLGTADLPVTLEVTEIGSDYVLGLQGDPVSGLRHIRGFRLRR